MLFIQVHNVFCVWNVYYLLCFSNLISRTSFVSISGDFFPMKPSLMGILLSFLVMDLLRVTFAIFCQVYSLCLALLPWFATSWLLVYMILISCSKCRAAPIMGIGFRRSFEVYMMEFEFSLGKIFQCGLRIIWF